MSNRTAEAKPKAGKQGIQPLKHKPGAPQPPLRVVLLHALVKMKQAIAVARQQGVASQLSAEALRELQRNIAKLPEADREDLDESLRRLAAYAADPSALPSWTAAEQRILDED